jgi:RNA polymerase sigma-70 factor (ECF subfamily)
MDHEEARRGLGPQVRRRVPEDAAADRIAQLYEAHNVGLRRYLRRFVASDHDAEDLLHVVFLRVIRHLPSFRSRGYGVEAWIYRIARNAAIDFLRERSREVLAGEQMPEPAVDRSASWDAGIDIRTSLDALSPAERRLVVMRLVMGMSSKDVARVEQRTPTSVDCAHHRATIKLRRELRNWEPARQPVAA